MSASSLVAAPESNCFHLETDPWSKIVSFRLAIKLLKLLFLTPAATTRWPVMIGPIAFYWQPSVLFVIMYTVCAVFWAKKDASLMCLVSYYM